MKHLLEFLVIAIIAAPFAVLPRHVAIRAGRLFGLLCYWLAAGRRRITVNNLRVAQQRGFIRADRTPESIARECFSNVGRIIAEVSRISYGLDRHVLDKVRFIGQEHLDNAMRKGKGFICVTGHFGNWELAAMSSSVLLHLSTIVARRQNNPYLDRLIVRLRQSMGNTLVYKEGAIRQFMKDLKAGKGIGMIMDEPVRPDKGTPVSFLGYRAGFQRTLHLLSKKYGAVVLPFVFSADEKGGYYIKMFPEITMTGDETEDTQKVARFLEERIAEDPAEWLQWFRKWKWAEPGQSPDDNNSAAESREGTA